MDPFCRAKCLICALNISSYRHDFVVGLSVHFKYVIHIVVLFLSIKYSSSFSIGKKPSIIFLRPTALSAGNVANAPKIMDVSTASSVKNNCKRFREDVPNRFLYFPHELVQEREKYLATDGVVIYVHTDDIVGHK